MNDLDRFYQWIIETPPLFKLCPPFSTVADLPSLPFSQQQPYSGNPRLGFLYQHLCTTLFIESPRYKLLAEEIQLNDDSGRTIGAIDMILKNLESDQYEHWEVAIKFYLLHQGIWYGPNAHDQLHTKLERMLSHQLKMSKRKEFHQQLPLDKPASEHLLMQGRLYINPFSPEATPQQCLGYDLEPSQIAGYWCYIHQWEQITEPLYLLSKSLWAIGQTNYNEPIEKPSNKFVHAQTKGGQFWFIVPDSWPNNVGT
ncbi:type II citrate synthase [Vibrio azureus]|uniref:Type II citrate synthase n=1 Tax=Vibrio azureus NBRC 104587 TaxID=1219077 RepID=U3C377_9VIBR|nr:DUF1853 family protein [Vibrio azureus]AUI85635.1 type II citrate synthase [Vibrio azureus]GAD75879.1 hypothetical protein VAZ01S_032_00230 [Vibrio azureus NBRC 104587]